MRVQPLLVASQVTLLWTLMETPSLTKVGFNLTIRLLSVLNPGM